MSVAALPEREKHDAKLGFEGKPLRSYRSLNSFNPFSSFGISLRSRRYIRLMLSKLVKDKIHQRFGQVIRYPKDCEPLALHISQMCKTRISGSTLRRLYGFVKGIREPRLYTLDIIAEYLGHQGWDQLIATFDKGKEVVEKSLERLKPEQIKVGNTVRITYEPGKVIEIRKTGTVLQVVSSNEKKLAGNDEIKFKLLELHYPITFTHVFRQGNSVGRVQVATISGITSIKKI